MAAARGRERHMSKSIVYYGHGILSIAGPRVDAAQAFRVHEIREAKRERMTIDNLGHWNP